MTTLKATLQQANARFIAGGGGDRLARLERGRIRAAALISLPVVLPRLFRKDVTRALGGEPISGTLGLNLKRGEGDGVDSFEIVFGGNGCRVARGRSVHPDATVTIGIADMIRLGSGAVDPGKFLAEGIGAGRIELTGDPFVMLAFPNLFGLANRKLI